MSWSHFIELITFEDLVVLLTKMVQNNAIQIISNLKEESMYNFEVTINSPILKTQHIKKPIVVTLAVAIDMLSYMAVEIGSLKWFKVLASMYNHFGDAAEDVCRRWSMQANEYSHGNFISSWNYLIRTAPTTKRPVTIATLIEYAKEGGWTNETHEDE